MISNDYEITGGVLIKYSGNSDVICIPDGVNKIGSQAFADVSAKEIIIPEGVIEIENYAFVKMHELIKVVFPSTLKKIGYRAFGDCIHLATNHLIIKGDVDIDENAFQGCCKEKAVDLICEVRYQIGEKVTDEKLRVVLIDDENTIKLLDEVIEDFISYCGDYDEIIDDAIVKYSASAREDGTYDYFAMYSELYDTALDYIDSLADGLLMTVKIPPHNNRAEQIITINVCEKLKEMIENRTGCECAYVDVGDAVERALYEYEQVSTWHVGLSCETEVIESPDAWPVPKFEKDKPIWETGEKIFSPIVWFGGEKPIKRWTIYPSISKEDYDFWFTKYDEGMQYFVPDADGGFEYWFFYECGRRLPDTREIINRCPIPFKEFDSLEIIEKRINNYFLCKKK